MRAPTGTNSWRGVARIAEMTATTPAGLAAQIRITMERFGYDGGSGMDQMEAGLLRSMLAGAERMAGVAS